MQPIPTDAADSAPQAQEGQLVPGDPQVLLETLETQGGLAEMVTQVVKDLKDY